MLDVNEKAKLRAHWDAVCQDLPADGVALTLDGQRIGGLATARVGLALEALPELQVNMASGQTLEWRSDGRTIEELSAAIGRAAQLLRERGAITGWRNELYRCEGEPLGLARLPPLFHLERAAFRFFGLRSRAVHVSGWTADGRIVASRRSLAKATDPGALDNLAAGGLGAEELPLDCARRELWEEAGVPIALSADLQALGLVHARGLVTEGLHDELLHVYRLTLPEGFVPNNRDGEVSEFLLLEPKEAVARLAEFSRDAAAVLASDLLG